jgi:hypothetical protein
MATQPENETMRKRRERAGGHGRRRRAFFGKGSANRQLGKFFSWTGPSTFLQSSRNMAEPARMTGFCRFQCRQDDWTAEQMAAEVILEAIQMYGVPLGARDSARAMETLLAAQTIVFHPGVGGRDAT